MYYTARQDMLANTQQSTKALHADTLQGNNLLANTQQSTTSTTCRHAARQ